MRYAVPFSRETAKLRLTADGAVAVDQRSGTGQYDISIAPAPRTSTTAGSPGGWLLTVTDRVAAPTATQAPR